MKPQWINGWREMVGRKVSKGKKKNNYRPACVKLKGNTSTTKSFRQALLNLNSKDASLIPVLFTITVRNYLGFHAFRINDERYTAHPYEQEFLLMEGIFVWVLKVEEILVKDWDSPA